jgi:CorA-like Mg2+ transporter protein
MDVNFSEPPAITPRWEVKGDEWIKNPGIDFTQLYMAMILQWSPQELNDGNSCSLKFLLPLLKMYIQRIDAITRDCYVEFLSKRRLDEVSLFEGSWRTLRDLLVKATVPFDSVKKYDLCHFEGMLQKSSSKLRQLTLAFDDLRETISELEQHIRDDLSLQVGELSLQESKESIRQSQIALDEGKKVNMLTTLAFFFVPVSLASSIFGMNLQEMNQSGLSFWVFVVTSAAFLLGVLLMWAIIYQWDKILHAPYIPEPQRPRLYVPRRTPRQYPPPHTPRAIPLAPLPRPRNLGLALWHHLLALHERWARLQDDLPRG